MYLLTPLLLAGLFTAPEDTLPTRWRLPELLAAVEARNPELELTRADAAAARARIGPVSRLPDPRLQVGLMNRSLPGLGRESPLAMDQIQLTQMFPVPGKLGAAIRGARARAAGVEADAGERRLALRLRSELEFFELDRIDRSVLVLQRTTRVLRDAEAIARTMYSVGTGRQADVLAAQVELARQDEELLAMQAMRAGAVARLNALLVRPVDAPIDSVLTPCFSDSLPPISVLVDAATGHRPMLASARARIEAAVAEQRRARLEIWPDFELGIAYGQQPRMGAPGTERMLSVMLGATLPLWSGSRQGGMRREADAMARGVEAELRAAEAETAGRIGELVAEVNRTRRLRALYQGSILPTARAAATAALAGYRNGGVGFTAVLDGHLTVVRYELQTIQLDADEAKAIAGLEALSAGDFFSTPAGGDR